MKKKLLICLGLILACFACMTISAYADDIVWTEMQDTSHLGQYGSIYYRLNDNGPYYCSDINISNISISSILESFVTRVDNASAADLYIYVNENCGTVSVYGKIPANFPQIDSFELYPKDLELFLDSDTECIKCNNLKIVGTDEFAQLRMNTEYFFEANNCDLECVDILDYAYKSNSSNYEPFIKCEKDGGEYNFTDVRFYGSTKGKAIDIEAPNVKVQMDGCAFSSDVHEGNYGAIFVNAEGAKINGNISGNKDKRTQFNVCKAVYGGGGIAVLANNTEVSGFIFNNCNAEYGGAVFAEDGITGLNISSCEFNGNTSSNDGAAIYVNGSGFNASNCTFNNNDSQDCGGAICSCYDNATIEKCIFKGNKSSDHGGAVYASGSSVTVKNCSFYGNTTENCGGGLFIDQDSDTVENCAFANNNAYDSNSGYGKSLYLDDKDGITLKTCKFGGSYSDEIYFKWGNTPAKENCEENLGANNFDNWGYFWQNQNTGSVFSDGNVAIIAAISAAALGAVAVMLEKKKKAA